MKMSSMKLSNFRGYQNEVEIKFDELTVLLGRNDVGKSTILEALDVFFNDGKGMVKLDKTDVNVYQNNIGNQETVLSVCFEELPSSIIIDTAVQTSLQEEYMLNARNQLEVIKKFKNGGAVKVFIKANHPTKEECADLLTKKNSELKKIVDKNDIECENQSVNATLRKSIWEHYESELELNEVEIDVTKEDGKKIWDKLIKYLPTYSLFQSDRKNSDSDDEIQDPLKKAVDQILAEEHLQELLFQIAEEVKTKLNDVSQRTLAKLREMDEGIANSLNPIIPASENLKWKDVFKNVSICGDSDIPINKRGSGVKRLVLLNFFRAEVERKLQNSEFTSVIYAVEEPETSQHSNNQHILIEAFKQLAGIENNQVILTTHSAYVVKQLKFENLRLISNCEDHNKTINNVEPGQLQYPSLNEVNYLAFGEISEEYHDELYSYIEIRNWKNCFIEGRPTRVYIRMKKNGAQVNEEKILTEYIRHQIHHPENRCNVRYTKEELKESIELMREFIEERLQREGVSEE